MDLSTAVYAAGPRYARDREDLEDSSVLNAIFSGYWTILWRQALVRRE